MRVLVGIPCLLTGGTEIQTLSLVKALVACGNEVMTVCYFEHSELMVRRYEDAGSKVCLLSGDGKRPKGAKATVVALWKGLRAAVKEWKPDVAHVQYMAPGAIPIVILRLLGVKKIIATAHTSGDIYKSLGLIHSLNKYILSSFQCITLRAEESFFGTSCLFGSDFKMKKHGNHFTIYNCLPDYIQVRETPKAFDEKIVTIGVVSRLEPIKGMDLVVPAFVEVHTKHPNTRLLIVGAGSLREQMEAQAAEADIMDAVEFVGRKPQNELQDYYDKIDILLMPSRSEGFGLTAIEGMARGCVPIVANTGGLPEVVEDGVTGLLHAPENYNDIADKICSVIDSKDYLIAMSNNANSRAKLFSFDTYKVKIKELYSKLSS